MIADKLKELRAEKGLTREAAAEKIGISVRTLANYERGERIPQGEILSSIADFYGVSREELLFDALRERECIEPRPTEKESEPPAPLPPDDERREAADEVPAAAAIPARQEDVPVPSAPREKKGTKKHKLQAWVIVLAVLTVLVLLDLVLFFIENLPVENGDSALGIVLDWRNFGIALLALLLFALAAFGIYLAVQTRKERPRRLFSLAICLFFLGMVGTGSLSAILCKDSFFAPAAERRGFAVWLRLDLQGDYDGNVAAQATNNFAIGFDAVQVRLTLYFSDTQTDSTAEMTSVQTVASDNLDIFRRIEISVPVETSGYWRAELVYKTNGSDWQQIQTETLFFNDRAILQEI